MKVSPFGPVASLLSLSSPLITTPYPIITYVTPGIQTCFTHTVPENDDAHLVFLALPVHENEEIESYYVDAMHSLSASGGEKMSGDFPEMPPETKEKISATDIGEYGLRLSLDFGYHETRSLHYHVPVIYRNVQNMGSFSHRDELAIGGMSICFDANKNEGEVVVLFDVVLVSDESDRKIGKRMEKLINRKEGMTPVQEKMKDIILLASDVLSEIGQVGRREFLMKQGTVQKNGGLAMFSYLSVGILLATSFVQVKYLKGYFRKKKLM